MYSRDSGETSTVGGTHSSDGYREDDSQIGSTDAR